ncbi:MAG: SagB/ThcOx family dehydrogenase [Defluviitaleaceae bacterium]|nr:SagB/ThcOx family dehydrogenase [Defluviitaleaceae bacterium]
MKKYLLALMLFIFVFSACGSTADNYSAGESEETGEALSEANVYPVYETVDSTPVVRIQQSEVIYILPEPRTDSNMSVEQALAQRRSRRNFQDKALSAEQLSQILWATYGITEPRPDAPRGGLRTTPSAGALFPLEIYVVIGNVEGIEPGVYRYISEENKIVQVISGDVRSSLAAAALGQRSVQNAPAILAISADFEIMLPRYGERGIMYIYIEVGHSAQNVYLQAEALGLGTVAVGAFIDDQVAEVLNLPENETPLYLMPFGYFN